jgi:hypothetical protein
MAAKALTDDSFWGHLRKRKKLYAKKLRGGLRKMDSDISEGSSSFSRIICHIEVYFNMTNHSRKRATAFSYVTVHFSQATSDVFRISAYKIIMLNKK